MADIYGRAGSQFGGAFDADSAKISFSAGGGGGAGGGVGLLTQQASFSYAQQITRLYEVGSNFEFFVAGRTQGQLSLARVLGPRKVQTSFYTNYGNVCHVANNNISVQLTETGCGSDAAGSGSLAFNVKNVVIVSLGISVGAQDMIINEQVSTMFVSLEAN